MLSAIVPNNSIYRSKTGSWVLLLPPLANFANLHYTGEFDMKTQTVPSSFSETPILWGLQDALRMVSFKSSFDILKGFKAVANWECGPLLNGTR